MDIRFTRFLIGVSIILGLSAWAISSYGGRTSTAFPSQTIPYQGDAGVAAAQEFFGTASDGGYMGSVDAAIAGLAPGGSVPYINVKAYGAEGDGVTDDTAALNLADTAASGGVLYIPAGTYAVSGWQIDHKVKVIADPNAIIQLADGQDVLTLNLTADGVEWYGGQINGNRANQSTGTCVVLNADDIRFSSAYIYSCASYGVLARDNNNFTFDNNRIEDTYNSSFLMQENGDGSSNIKILSNIFDRSDETPPAHGSGLQMASAQSIAQAWFTDVVIEGNNIVFPAGTIDTNANVGIETEYVYNVAINSNTIRRGNIGVSATYGENISFNGNVVDIDNTSAREGMEIATANNCTFSNNTINGNGVLYRGILTSSFDTTNYPIKNITITGNKIRDTIDSTIGSCISVQTTPTNIAVTGNVCSDTYNGIQINDGSFVTISGNSLFASGSTDKDGVEVGGESNHIAIVGNVFRATTVNLYHNSADTIDNMVITSNIFSTNSFAYFRTTISGGGTIGDNVYVWDNIYNNGATVPKQSPYVPSCDSGDILVSGGSGAWACSTPP